MRSTHRALELLDRTHRDVMPPARGNLYPALARRRAPVRASDPLVRARTSTARFGLSAAVVPCHACLAAARQQNQMIRRARAQRAEDEIDSWRAILPGCWARAILAIKRAAPAGGPIGCDIAFGLRSSPRPA